MKIISSEDIFSLIKDKDISIVGSSPELKGSGLGSKIDSNDIVVRFNDALLFYKDNKEDYGSKCNIYATSGWSPDFNETNSLDKHKSNIDLNSTYILGTRPLDNSNVEQLKRGLIMRGPVFNWVSQVECNFISMPNEIFNLPILNGNFNLSSGIATLLLILHFNPKSISMFGFNFFNYKKPTHFWNNDFFYTEDSVRKKEGHDGSFEKQLVVELCKNFNIKVHE